MTDPFGEADDRALRDDVERHDVALVLGSGWGDAASALGDVTWEGPLSDVPGVPKPTVGGHKGKLVSVAAAAATCWCSRADRISTRATRSTRSCTACAPRSSPGAGS